MVDIYYNILINLAIKTYQSTVKITELVHQDIFISSILLGLITYIVVRAVLYKITSRKVFTIMLFLIGIAYLVSVNIYLFNTVGDNYYSTATKIFLTNLVVISTMLVAEIIFLISTRKRKKRSIYTRADGLNLDNKEQVYKKHDSIFTINEQRFYKQLKAVIDILNKEYKTSLVVFTKVRVLDIIKTEQTKKLQNMHIDFVLCDATNNHQYIAAIELDDSSHNTDSQRKNDAHKNNSFGYINLPLIRFRSISHGRAYSKQDIFQDLFSKITYKFDTKHPHPLILRQGGQRWFFGCVEFFPSNSNKDTCKHTLSIPYNLTKF